MLEWDTVLIQDSNLLHIFTDKKCKCIVLYYLARLETLAEALSP